MAQLGRRFIRCPITGTGGGFTRTAQVGLLVGGTRVYLPVLRKVKYLENWDQVR